MVLERTFLYQAVRVMIISFMLYSLLFCKDIKAHNH